MTICTSFLILIRLHFIRVMSPRVASCSRRDALKSRCGVLDVGSPFTNNVEDVQSRMLPASAKGKTALLDAIYLGLTQMRGAANGKRALLIISDGGDNNSRYNEKDIKRLLREAATQLYSVGIFEPF
jgi:Ca-activated chloride channel family protein